MTKGKNLAATLSEIIQSKHGEIQRELEWLRRRAESAEKDVRDANDSLRDHYLSGNHHEHSGSHGHTTSTRHKESAYPKEEIQAVCPGCKRPYA